MAAARKKELKTRIKNKKDGHLNFPLTGWSVKKQKGKTVLVHNQDSIKALELPEADPKGKWEVFLDKPSGYDVLWMGEACKEIYGGMHCSEYYSANCNEGQLQACLDPGEDEKALAKMVEGEKALKKKFEATKQKIKELGEELLIELVTTMSQKGGLNKLVKTLNGYEAGEMYFRRQT